MDIVLSTIFNNANLPIVEMPGFTDGFSRGDANTLGTTDDGKPWEIVDYLSSASVWGTFGNGSAGLKSAAAYFHLAVANARSNNGSLTATVSTVDSAAFRIGVSVRTINADNFLAVAPSGTSNSGLRLSGRIAGESVIFSGTGPTLAAGDVVRVDLDDATVTAFVNDVQFVTAEVPELMHATRHGLYAFAGSIGSWDSVTFTP